MSFVYWMSAIGLLSSFGLIYWSNSTVDVEVEHWAQLGAWGCLVLAAIGFGIVATFG